MAPMKIFAVLALGALVERAVCVPQAEAQITAAPAPIVLGTLQAITPAAATTGSSDDCGGCYLVADVSALVWYSEVFINTVATALVGVNVANGTNATTTTSIIRNEAEVTFDTDRMGTELNNVPLTSVSYDSTLNYNGAILRSPTAYNVYQAYAITSEQRIGDRCVTTFGETITLPTPYSQILPSTSGAVSVAGLEDFVNFLSFRTCSNNVQRLTEAALVPVADITTTTTTTGSRVSLAAQSQSLAPTTNPTSTSKAQAIITLTNVMESTTVTATLTGTAFPLASASAPLIIAGSSTFTPNAAAITLAGVDVTEILPNGTFAIAGTGSETIGTVVGTGVGNYSIVPFVSGAANFRGLSTITCGIALASILLIVGLL